MENTNTNSNTNSSNANALASLLRAGQTFPLPFQVCNFFFALKDAEDKAQFIGAVFSYILEGRETPLASLQVATLFDVIKRDLETLRLKRERISAQRKEAGDKGRETLRTQRELAKRLAQTSTPQKGPSTAPKVEPSTPAKKASDPVATMQKLLDQKETRKAYIAKYMRERRKDPAKRESENAGKRARYARGKKTQAKRAGK